MIQQQLFQLMDSTETGIDFINTVKDSANFNIFNFRNFYNGGGVGIGDINNDGLPDVFFTSNQGTINYISTKAILSLKIYLQKQAYKAFINGTPVLQWLM